MTTKTHFEKLWIRMKKRYTKTHGKSLQKRIDLKIEAKQTETNTNGPLCSTLMIYTVQKHRGQLTQSHTVDKPRNWMKISNRVGKHRDRHSTRLFIPVQVSEITGPLMPQWTIPIADESGLRGPWSVAGRSVGRQYSHFIYIDVILYSFSLYARNVARED